MEHVFIINSNSGDGKYKEVVSLIQMNIINKKIDGKIIYTKSSNHAKSEVLKYKNSGCIIHSIGGDGTLNSVVNGLVSGRSKLNIIPVGSGNDFCKTLDKTKNEVIDVGYVNDRHFINIASVGLDANIAEYANYLKKYNLPSNSIYILSLIRNYFKFKPINLDINDENKNITILAACNGRYYGGGFKIAPHADLSDGKLDIYAASDMNKLKELAVLSKLLIGKHEKDDTINFYRDTNLKINSNIPLTVNIDGEIVKEKDLNIGIKPKSLILSRKNIVNDILKDANKDLF